MKLKVIGTMLFLLLLLSACNPTFAPMPTPTPTPTLRTETPKGVEGIVVALSFRTNTFGGLPRTVVYLEDGRTVRLRGHVHLVIGKRYYLQPEGSWLWSPDQVIRQFE